MAESALLVPVPEAEPLVAPFRRRLDPTGFRGVPAHITVVTPFVPGQLIGTEVTDALASLFAGMPRFECTLTRPNWFDDRVLYLEPEPAHRFRAMTESVLARFPEYPPYGGAFEEVVPHLTIAEGGRWRRRRRAMRRAAGVVETSLPVSARVSEVWLMVFDDRGRRWERVRTFALG